MPRSTLFDRRSIRYPFARLIIAAVLMGIGMALVSDALLMLDNVRSDIRRNLTNAANAAGTAANAAVVFQDAKVARGVLRMFEAYPEVEAAALYTLEGERLASYGNEILLPPSASNLTPVKADIELLADTAIFYLPIQVDDAPVGHIYLQARLDNYWHTYLGSIATTFLVALSAGLVALILSMRYLNRIILPVRMLAEAANDARLRQDFVPRSIPAADNEIGDLVRNFNALLAEVETGRKSLQSQHDELERLVAARTSELLAAKESADEANAAKSRFLAAASHDLRQPIHAMSLFQEALSNTPLNEEQHRIANYIALSTRSLAGILNALLDVSRLDSGVVQARPELIGAYDLLRNVEEEFAPLALAKGLRFKFYFPAREMMLFTDGKLLYGLLRNLIDNAIKYTETGGVLIGFRRRQGMALIQVWDTGTGIAAKDIEVIFDEYFQVGNPQRDRTLGLGLGLSIAKRMAEILGCRIHCRSRLNKGSIFEVSLPLAEAATPGQPDEPGMPLPADRQPAHCSGCRVVVVEDDAMAAKALELSLKARSLQAMIHASAESALAAFPTEMADFYLVDYRLPGMNGIQFLDEVQKRSPQPIKALLLTGESARQDIDTNPLLRWKVLFKPLDAAALMAVMEDQMAAGRNETRSKSPSVSDLAEATP